MLGHKPTKLHYIKSALSYIVLTVSVVVVTLLVLAMSRGYTFDIDEQEVVHRGLVRLESNPTALVFVDGVNTAEQTPARLNLEDGTHNVEMFREGYLRWQKDVRVIGGTLKWITYPFMIRSDVVETKTEFESIGDDEFTSFDPRSNYLITSSNLALTRIFELTKPTSPVLIDFKSAVDGDLKTSTVKKALWSRDGQVALLRIQNDEEKTQWLRFNSTSKQLTDVTTEVKGFNPIAVMNYREGFVLLRESGKKNLFLRDLGSEELLALSANATDYDVADATVVWHDKGSPNLEGWHEGKLANIPALQAVSDKTNLLTTTLSGAVHVAYETNGNSNIVVSAFNSPFERRLRQTTSLVSFNNNGEYLLGRGSDERWVVYELKSFNQWFVADLDQTNMRWAGTDHLISINNQGVSLREFDGANALTLYEGKNIDQARLSVDKHISYTVVDEGDKVNIYQNFLQLEDR